MSQQLSSSVLITLEAALSSTEKRSWKYVDALQSCGSKIVFSTEIDAEQVLTILNFPAIMQCIQDPILLFGTIL